LRIRHLAVALMIIVIFSSTPAKVSSQSGERSTSIIDLRYSTEPVYNVETPWAEVTVAYQDSPTGWYLAIDLIDLTVLEARRGTSWFGDINQITGKETMQTWVGDSRAGLVKGTVAGTPIECGEDFPVSGGSMPMTVKGYTWCVLAIGGSAQPIYLSGQENVRFQLSDLTPGTWRLRVLAGLYLTRGAGFGPALETISFKDISMCGYIPTAIMLMSAEKLGASKAELVKYSDSGEVTGDTDQVVGYAGIIVF